MSTPIRAQVSLLERGNDPSLVRKQEKAAAKVSAENSFVRVAEEYLETMDNDGHAPATLRKSRWFLSLLEPAIGSMPVREVDPQLRLAALRKLEAKRNCETAKKVRIFASRAFRFAGATGRASSDPAFVLNGACQIPSSSAVKLTRGLELIIQVDGTDVGSRATAPLGDQT